MHLASYSIRGLDINTQSIASSDTGQINFTHKIVSNPEVFKSEGYKLRLGTCENNRIGS